MVQFNLPDNSKLTNGDYYKSQKDNEKITKEVPFKDLLDKDDEGKRILYVIPESIGDVFISTSLFFSGLELISISNSYFDILLFV